MEKEEMKNTKPRIALMIDKEGWALDNSAKQIKKYLSDYYDIDIIPMDIFGDNAIKILILANLYDLMFFMWRGNIVAALLSHMIWDPLIFVIAPIN